MATVPNGPKLVQEKKDKMRPAKNGLVTSVSKAKYFMKNQTFGADTKPKTSVSRKDKSVPPNYSTKNGVPTKGFGSNMIGPTTEVKSTKGYNKK